MSAIKRIGIITGGGDCGGLNAVIKGAARTAESLGIEAYVIPNGYAGLYNLVEFDRLTRLTPQRVDSVSSALAGSEAGHSRVKIKKIDDERKYERIKEGLAKFGIDALVISGGDDTGAVMLDLAGHGIQCIHVPKTMDLDLQTYSVGADSTINRIADFAEDIKTTGVTHNRILVMEVFGRYAGHTAFRGGIGADADCILIPEVPADFDVVYEHMKKKYFERIRTHDVHAGTYLIIVAEGLRDVSGKELVDESAGVDAFGHKKLAGAAKYIRQELSKRLKADPEVPALMKEVKLFVKGLYEAPEVREVTPGHLVRSGRSSAYDVNFGMEGGAAAIHLLLAGISSATVVEVKGATILYKPTVEVIEQRLVDLDVLPLYEAQGVCFGRTPEVFSPRIEKHEGKVWRHL